MRNLPPAIARAIRETAAGQGLSLNKAVVHLLEVAARAKEVRNRELFHDLDHLFGTWSNEEADRFDEAVAGQRPIDSELWR